MIDFRALGTTAIVHSDGHSVASVLAQPKRLALLAYLALAAPRGGFVRRDTLLGLFWPESDSEHARAALRQAVRFLRRSLGEQVLINRGEEEIGVAPGALRCDVYELEKLLDAGDDAGAVDCYRGDLLEGFFIDDAPEWERWLDAERLRLRRRAAAAAARLADGAAERDSWEEAVAYARRACALGGGGETAIRRLIVLLDRAGDRASAVAEYEKFAARIASELDLEPSPETRALIDDVRSRSESDAAVPNGLTVPFDRALPVAAAPAVGEAHSELPLATAPLAGVAGSGRRVARVTVRAALVAMLLLASAAYLVRNGRSDGALRPHKFLVVPFENHTGDSARDPLGLMAAGWISEGIAGVGATEVVTLTELLSSAKHLQEAGNSSGRDQVSALARDVGAGRVITGSYYLQSGRLLFQARITDVQSGTLIRAIEAVNAAPDSSLAGVEEVRARIRAVLAPLMEERSHARAISTPPTYEAYRDYVTGMEAFVRRDLRTALRHMESAAVADSSYSMPRIVTAIIHMNMGDWAAADSVIRGVHGLRARMGPLELATHDMVAAWLRGDDGAAYEAVVRQTQLAPGTIAHYQVAEQARRLNRPREALRVLRELGPERGELRGWIFYWREIVWSHHALGDHRSELRAARKSRETYGALPEAMLYEARALAALGRVAGIEAIVQQRLANSSTEAPSPGVFLWTVGLELRAHGHAAAGADMLERSVEWYRSRPPAQQRQWRTGLATALYLSGDLVESRTIFEELVLENPRNVHAIRHLGTIAARRGDRAEAERIAAWLRDLDEPYLFGQDTYARACIAALLNQPGEAVRLLHEAIRDGMHYRPDLHIDPDLESLKGDAAFAAFLKPAG